MLAESASSVLTPWSSFYVMAGSSAAALTGLMFVVITLVTGERMPRSSDGVSTFSTPTVVHFGVALLVSAMLSAPWRSLVHPGVLLGLTGLYGVFYIMNIGLRARRLTTYQPDLEDWTWYTILPFVAYGAILAGGVLLPIIPVNALFSLAGGVALLIFLGIRNAWDVVTFLAIGPRATADPDLVHENESAAVGKEDDEQHRD
ncbi:MAG TPA: hypothetical protein VKG44_05155 [Candidatus Baltobacteraceae bacterium]|nr:hypothetical protein [Candidatus Baltobacteraceae bacterium]